MAINPKIAESLVKEVVNDGELPFAAYVYDESTRRGYEVTVRQVSQKGARYIVESRVPNVLGPSGPKCGCCDGTGRA